MVMITTRFYSNGHLGIEDEEGGMVMLGSQEKINFWITRFIFVFVLPLVMDARKMVVNTI